MKAEHQKSGGVLQEFQVPTWMWEVIIMNFLVGLPRTQKQYDSILVVVDRLTKSAYFISVKSSYSVEDNARIFIDDIVCIHGIPLSIICDRGAQLTSTFSRLFKRGLGAKVKRSTSFHLQTDGQTEVLFKSLRICLEHVSFTSR